MRALFSKLQRRPVPALIAVVAAVMVLNAAAFAADEDYEPQELTGRKVAILVGEGFQDAETLVPIGFLVNRGAAVTVVGVEPGFVKAYNSDTYARVEKSVDDVNPEDFDAVVIPGGHSPAYLRKHDNAVAFARAAVEQGKVTAAICHGPQVLITAGVLEGKKTTAYSGVADELREAGATYEDVPMMQDGNIITSRVPKDLPVFLRTIEEALADKG
ncbi:MAG: type 1 glutamine amidotransferase domain-containing protein [Candidatus Hydrogenedentota bacterium]